MLHCSVIHPCLRKMAACEVGVTRFDRGRSPVSGAVTVTQLIKVVLLELEDPNSKCFP